ncbi:hypothetical protein [Roseibium aggregatum]|uniref:hypothetical protein n=1 Tax=Roseibium aggregatum TaxID=187304 RepID=UPI001E48D444|nr:hypothetical protein [Roseibium aggregatum]UES41980.1 hypothetical protein GFC08_28630 [Roseibium aggregatum]
MSDRFGGAFSSSEFGAMARDDGAPAAPACPQHAVPKQNPGDRRTAYQQKATFGRMPVLFFPVARADTGGMLVASQ